MAEKDNAKAGVDFEWVNSNAKDSKGNPVKTRRFFTRAEKKAMKEGKKPETKAAPAKPANKPAKAAAPTASQRPKARPKAEPAKTNSVRPEGKAAGMPAADKNSGAKNAARAAAVGATVLGARAIAQAGKARPRKPAQAKPVNPSFTGRAGSPEGFRGRFETGVARAAGKGAGMRRIGPGGAGMKSAIDKAKDPLMLMAKGGMVKKKK